MDYFTRTVIAIIIVMVSMLILMLESKFISELIYNREYNLNSIDSKSVSTVLGKKKVHKIEIDEENNGKIQMKYKGILYKHKVLYNVGKTLMKWSQINGSKDIEIIMVYEGTNDYGNKQIYKILRVKLNKETLDKINWSKFETNKIPQIANEYIEYRGDILREPNLKLK